MALTPTSAPTSIKILGSWLGDLFRVEAVLLVLWQYGEKRDNVYNILWALVFAFATLNILGLVARRFEPSRNRLSFGEFIAITVVCVSVLLLGWEMLFLFKILPIKLQPHF